MPPRQNNPNYLGVATRQLRQICEQAGRYVPRPPPRALPTSVFDQLVRHTVQARLPFTPTAAYTAIARCCGLRHGTTPARNLLTSLSSLRDGYARRDEVTRIRRLVANDRDRYVTGLGARGGARTRRRGAAAGNNADPYHYGNHDNSLLSDFHVIENGGAAANAHPVINRAFKTIATAVIIRSPSPEEITSLRLKDDILKRLRELIDSRVLRDVTRRTKYAIRIESKDGSRSFTLRPATFDQLDQLLTDKYSNGDYDNVGADSRESSVIPHEGLKVTIMVSDPNVPRPVRVGGGGDDDDVSSAEGEDQLQQQKKKQHKKRKQRISIMDTRQIVERQSVHIITNHGGEADQTCVTRAIAYQTALFILQDKLPRPQGWIKVVFADTSPEKVVMGDDGDDDAEGKCARTICDILGFETDTPLTETDIDKLAEATGYIINIIEPEVNGFRRKGINKTNKKSYHGCAHAAYVSKNAQQQRTEDQDRAIPPLPVFLLRVGNHVHLITDIYMFLNMKRCTKSEELCPGPHRECNGHVWCTFHGRMEPQRGRNDKVHTPKGAKQDKKDLEAMLAAGESDSDGEGDDQDEYLPPQPSPPQQQQTMSGEEAYIKRDFGCYSCKLCGKIVLTRNHICTVHPRRLVDETVESHFDTPFTIKKQIKCLNPATIMVDMDFECMLLPPDPLGRRFHEMNLGKLLAPKLSSQFYTAHNIKEAVDLLLITLPKEAQQLQIVDSKTEKALFTVRMHNGGGYDFNFIIRELYHRGEIICDLLMRECRIISFSLIKPSFEIQFRDTFNMIPVALSEMQATLGLKGDFKKGDFPHLFNTVANQSYIGPWPALEFYTQSQKEGKRRGDIDKFWFEHKDQQFDFQKEFNAYCEQDVRIQAAAANAFSEIFAGIIKAQCEKLGVEYVPGMCDPWCYNTIAGYTQVLFEAFLIPRTKEDIDSNNYPTLLNSQQRSKILSSRKEHMWLKWLNEPRMQIGVRVAVTPKQGLKVSLTGLNVDGFVPPDASTILARPDYKGKVYEFYGDFFHGNPKTQNTPAAKLRALKVLHLTPEDLFNATKFREQWLRDSGYDVEIIWESDWDNEVKNMDAKMLKDLETFADELELKGPMNPRDALFGGRTEAFYMFFNTNAKNQQHKNRQNDMNRCLVCHKDLGECNPRQLCGKTKCDNDPENIFERYVFWKKQENFLKETIDEHLAHEKDPAWIEEHHRAPFELQLRLERLFDANHMVDRYMNELNEISRPYDSHEPAWKIDYKDVISEYPAMMNGRFYPTGPDPDFEPTITPAEATRRIIENKRLGIVKCKVLAPAEGLNIPVLPVRECPDSQVYDTDYQEHQDDVIEQDDEDQDSDLQQTAEDQSPPTASTPKSKATKLIFRLGEMTGTWTTVDLEYALACGYKILEVYDSVWFKSKRDDIFRNFVATFFKLKTEASGLKDIPPNMTLDEYAAQFETQFPGYTLDKAYIQALGNERNEGLRFIAKLCLNSLWGKYGLNQAKYTKREFVDSANDFLALLYDPNVEVISWVDLTDTAVLVESRVLNQAEEPDNVTSLAIAAFTTAYGRKHLNSYIHMCERNGGIPLYCDTDSLVYAYDSAAPQFIANGPPLPVGSKLGELSDEFKGDYGVEYVSIGAKTYSIVTSKGKADKFRAKGVEMDFATSRILNHLALSDLVKEKTKEVIVPQQRVAEKTSDFRVFSRKFHKSIKVTFNKRRPLLPVCTRSASSAKCLQLVEIGSEPF